MGKGISINIGLNHVDANQYNGWPGDLVACEFDANDMAAIAKNNGFEVHKFLTAEATAAHVIAAITKATTKLAAGDTLLLTYSGHGGQVPDKNSDEPDRLDETWVFYDRQLVDDELYTLWSQFQAGVRIAVLSDSCHSGTVLKLTIDAVRPEALRNATGSDSATEPRMKVMPAKVCMQNYEANKATYDGIQESVPAGDKADVRASVLLISGCQDNQTSSDGDRNGLFTQTLLQIWNDGKFRGGWRTFAKRIVAKMPPWQSPNFQTVGHPDRTFERAHPFTT